MPLHMTSQATIRALDTWLVDVHTIRPHKLSVATLNTQTLVLVRIQTTDDQTGWGEGTTIGGLAVRFTLEHGLSTDDATRFFVHQRQRRSGRLQACGLGGGGARFHARRCEWPAHPGPARWGAAPLLMSPPRADRSPSYRRVNLP